YTTPTSFPTTTAGSYMWAASYTGDGNNTAVSVCGNQFAADKETLTVNPATPTLTASGPSTGTAGTVIGASSISATITGLVNAGSGTITFQVFGPGSEPSTCTGGTMVGTTVSAPSNGTYHPTANVTRNQAGNFWWYAAYSGDGTNNNPSTSACGTGMSETV